MSFFNLTLTGVQDPFKTASYNKEGQTNLTDATITRPTETEAAEKVEQSHEEDQSQKQSNQLKTDPTPLSHTSLPSASPLTPTHVQTMYSSSETGNTGRNWHRGSHTQYTELLRKHQRHPQGPLELYQHPLTTSNEYGWWLKNGAPHKEESERRAHVNSEMTRFVDDMSLTNKEFSLY